MAMVRPMGRRRSRAEGTLLSEGLHPNDLWCTDYKGQFQLNDSRYCYPLTVTDYSVLIWRKKPCSPWRTPSGQKCNLCLRNGQLLDGRGDRI